MLVTYLITFTTYGSPLHGDDRGSVDRNHNQPGSPALEPSPELRKFERRSMPQSSYLLDETRTNHIHAIVDVDCVPDVIAIDIKRYATRALNQSKVDYPDRKRWTRGFSVRLLPDRAAIDSAIHYVAINLGEPMELFVADQRAPYLSPLKPPSPRRDRHGAHS